MARYLLALILAVPLAGCTYYGKTGENRLRATVVICPSCGSSQTARAWYDWDHGGVFCRAGNYNKFQCGSCGRSFEW